MLKKRLVAVLVVCDGKIVQSEQFRHPHKIHDNPVFAMDCFNKWAVDEIMTLNVSRSPKSRGQFLDVVAELSDACFLPHTVGGWIETEQHAVDLLHCGADKVVINTRAYEDRTLVPLLADRLGRQCVVVSIDAKKDAEGTERVCVDRGARLTATAVVDWAREAERLGAGELLLNSVAHDGMCRGYNLECMAKVKNAVSIPVIGFGGASEWGHFKEGVEQAGLDAVAAANVFHYSENSCKKAKRYLLDQSLPFRSMNGVKA